MDEVPHIGPRKTAAFRRPPERLIPNPKAKLREQFREVCRFKHLSPRTEEAYWGWARRFMVWARDHPHLTPVLSPPSEGAEREKTWRHPREMGAAEVQEFLTHLATQRRVAAATQNQALNALVFFYGQVLGAALEEEMTFARAQRPKRLPVVLSQNEVKAMLASVSPEFQLPVRLLYGSGLRLTECLCLRVKDMDLPRRQITVRAGKGDKDRVTLFPESLVSLMEAHLHRVRGLHDKDLAAGFGAVWLPKALGVKYPRVAREWPWQWVFPSAELSVDPEGSDQGSTESRPTESRLTRMCCDIPLPPICWRTATTFARCRIYWGIMMFRRRRFIRM